MLESSLESYPPPLWPLIGRHLWIWCLVPIAAVLCSCFLDYLFARSLGGICILLANELLRQAFIRNLWGRPAYSVCCLLLGVAGLFLLGTPWRLRDALELSGRHRGLRWSLRGALGGLALLFLILSCV